MNRINLCLLGCGSVARLHSRVARKLRSQVNLLYASRSRAKAETYNRKFRGIGAFGSYEEACADPRVDAVFICTPHAFHAEHAQLGARYGKHLLIEKPVARNLAELKAIEDAVAVSGTFAMVAENYFFKPVVRVVRHHIERGDIGVPLVIELNRVGRTKVKGWRSDGELMGGGALLEGGVHWLNLLFRLWDKPREVVACQPEKSYGKVAPFEDILEVLFKFADGSIGKLLHAWNLSNRIGGLAMSKIFGTHGRIHFESNGLFALVLGRRRRLRFPGFLDLMGRRAMLQHFVESVRDNRIPAMSLATARRDLAAVAAAYRSLETGRFEPLPVE